MLHIENLENKFRQILSTSDFKGLQKAYTSATNIFYIGNGGNLAIADHAAIDSSRLTNKNIMSPGSGIEATSIITDTKFTEWLKNWIKIRSNGIVKSKSLLVGFSCSTNGESSESIVNAIQYADSIGISTGLISAQVKEVYQKLLISFKTVSIITLRIFISCLPMS